MSLNYLYKGAYFGTDVKDGQCAFDLNMMNLFNC